jgi:hypothetical protein
MEEAQVAPLFSMDGLHPAVFLSRSSPKHEPQISETGRHHQSGQPFRIGQVTLMEVKASALLVREEGLDPVSLLIPAEGFLC